MKVKTIKKEESSSVNNMLGVLAVVVVIIAVVSLVATYIKISSFNKEVLGYATQQASAYVNLTVNTNVGIAVGPSIINWGNGTVNTSEATCKNSTLATYGLGSNVTCGNWSNATVTGINISNIGNVNCSLNISGLMNYTQFFGATASGGMNYSWNVSMKEANSCSGGTNFSDLNTWVERNGDVTLAQRSLNYCANFGFMPAANEIWLDVKIIVPSTLNNTQQNAPISDTINITCG